MKMKNIPLKKVEEAIQHFPPKQQAKLLKDLPKLLSLNPSDMARLRLAEHTFAFWDNNQDSEYDRL